MSKRVLIFGGEPSPYHDFSVQGPLLERLVRDAGHEAELTCDAGSFALDRIAPFDVVAILASSGSLAPEEEASLLAAVSGDTEGRTGRPKGLLGIHGATVLTSESGRYQRMLGARFLTHPPLGPFRVTVENAAHPVMAGVSDFSISDELYLMEAFADVDVLFAAELGGFSRPLAWLRPWGMGRVCYCALGHGTEQLENPSVQRVLRNALDWL